MNHKMNHPSINGAVSFSRSVCDVHLHDIYEDQRSSRLQTNKVCLQESWSILNVKIKNIRISKKLTNKIKISKRFTNHKTNTRKSLIDITISGTLIGIACFLLKIVLSGAIISRYLIINIMLSPLAWTAIVLVIIGFILMQRAFYSGLISIAMPLLTGISIAIPVVLSIIFVSEPIAPLKMLSIIIIVFGVVVLSIAGLKKMS